jgi:hypothetical protein
MMTGWKKKVAAVSWQKIVKSHVMTLIERAHFTDGAVHCHSWRENSPSGEHNLRHSTMHYAFLWSSLQRKNFFSALNYVRRMRRWQVKHRKKEIDKMAIDMIREKGAMLMVG